VGPPAAAAESNAECAEATITKTRCSRSTCGATGCPIDARRVTISSSMHRTSRSEAEAICPSSFGRLGMHHPCARPRTGTPASSAMSIASAPIMRMLCPLVRSAVSTAKPKAGLNGLWAGEKTCHSEYLGSLLLFLDDEGDGDAEPGRPDRSRSKRHDDAVEDGCEHGVQAR
jgi:hypothetical protein